MSFLYVASRAKNGGIYKYAFDGERYNEVSFASMDCPMYMIVEKNHMHVLLREPFFNKESGYVRYRITDSGDLQSPSPILSTKGEIACHLHIKNDNAYCVNYTSGSIIKMPDHLVVHKGDRQSHTHFVGSTPDEKYLCVTDLGLDRIFLYDDELNVINRVAMPMGCGVRHLVFLENNYVFSANELDATVSALRYEDGNMRLIDTVSCKSLKANAAAAPSAIRVRNHRIYVAVRGDDTICTLSFEQEKLKLQDRFCCQGKTPRDFCFDENRLICCNQDSNTVTVFQEVNGAFKYIQSIEMECPICTLTN